MKNKMIQELVQISAVAGSLMERTTIPQLDSDELLETAVQIAEKFVEKAEKMMFIERKEVYDHAISIFAHKEFIEKYAPNVAFEPVKEFQNTDNRRTFYFYANKAKLGITVDGNKKVSSIDAYFNRLIVSLVNDEQYQVEEMLYNESYLIVKGIKE